MRPRLLQWLACPTCRGQLESHAAACTRAPVLDADQRAMHAVSPIGSYDEVETDIITGALSCAACKVYYPIHNGVPRMLVFETEVARVHAQDNAGWLNVSLPGFRLPSGAPPPGETTVLRNFSREWTDYEWTGKAYWNTTPEALLTSKRYELGGRPLNNQLLLEVGIGIGGAADSLSRTGDCEIVGMDLGYAVDQARRYFGANPRFHIVQASVFAPPFRPGVFDVVYSHGVIHHTYSTRTALAKVAKLPKPQKGMLYIWVYSHEQERATPLRRILMTVEDAFRPIISRLPGVLQTAALVPAVPFYVLYQNFYATRKLGSEYAARYGWNEALHAARDRLTPFFAFRHSYEEIASWFREEGFRDLEFLRDDPLPPGVPPTYPLNVGIRGFR